MSHPDSRGLSYGAADTKASSEVRGSVMNLVERWECTRERELQEPLLVFHTLEGHELAFLLPAAAAEELGRALMAQARRTGRAGPAH